MTSKLVAARPGAGEAGSDEVGDWSEAPSLPATGFGLGPSDPETAFADLPPEKRPAPFPYGSEDPQSGREPDHAKATGALLRYLRQHSNYLMPGEGITPTSVVVVLLRLIILNLLVWIPILAAVMWSLIWLSVPHVPDTVIRVVPAPVTEFAPWAPTWLAEFVGDISPPLKSEVKAPGIGGRARRHDLAASARIAEALFLWGHARDRDLPVLRLRACVRELLSRNLARSQVEPFFPRWHEVRLAPTLRTLDARAVLDD